MVTMGKILMNDKNPKNKFIEQSDWMYLNEESLMEKQFKYFYSLLKSNPSTDGALTGKMDLLNSGIDNIYRNLDNLIDLTFSGFEEFRPGSDFNIRRVFFELYDFLTHLDVSEEIQKDIDRKLIKNLNNKLHKSMTDFFDDTKDESKLLHLFNSGFIIKLNGTYIAIDITTGPISQKSIDFEKWFKIVDKIDCFFVSHNHDDHFDEVLLKYAIEQGKTVILPFGCENIISGNAKVVSSTFGAWVNFGNFEYYIGPGMQENTPNNITMFKTDKFEIMHLGDNTCVPSWLHAVKKINYILHTNWIPTKDITDKIETDAIISMHENELEHNFYHRISYRLSFNAFKDKPLKPLFLGETMILEAKK